MSIFLYDDIVYQILRSNIMIFPTRLCKVARVNLLFYKTSIALAKQYMQIIRFSCSYPISPLEAFHIYVAISHSTQVEFDRIFASRRHDIAQLVAHSKKDQKNFTMIKNLKFRLRRFHYKNFTDNELMIFLNLY